MMIPRFRRALLLLSVLSVLVIPTGRAQAQAVEEFTGTVGAGDVVGCQPDPMMATSHIRCEGTFANAVIALEATRAPAEGIVEELRCESVNVGGIAFRARQTLAEGRGFVAPGGVSHAATPGQLVRLLDGVPDGVENVTCRIRVADGVFHRVGTVAYGRITVDIHAERADPPTGVNVWREIYCTRFDASAVPDPVIDPPRTIVQAVANGRVPCTPDTAAHDVGRGLPDVPPYFGDDAFHG
jgi:hypothetical protein